MNLSLSLRACCLATLGIVLHGSAQEWTRFRGPNGTGTSYAKTIPAPAWAAGKTVDKTIGSHLFFRNID
jgi:hypothetical protein